MTLLNPNPNPLFSNSTKHKGSQPAVVRSTEYSVPSDGGEGKLSPFVGMMLSLCVFEMWHSSKCGFIVNDGNSVYSRDR